MELNNPPAPPISPKIETPAIKHRYYTPTAGRWAALVIERWKGLDYTAQSLNCSVLQMTPSTLYQKLHYGMQWCRDNTTGDVQKYWADMCERTNIRRKQYSVEITLTTDAHLFTSLANIRVTELLASFDAWVHADPPFKAKWPTVQAEVYLEPEHIETFKARRAELQAQNFWTVARIQSNEILFVRIPPPVGMDLGPKEEPAP